MPLLKQEVRAEGQTLLSGEVGYGGFSYRYINGIDVPGYVKEDCSGVTGMMTFELGKS